MMCASLAAASTTRPHLDFIHLEAGTAQTSDEWRLRTGRPYRQYPAAPQRRVGGGQPRQAVKPVVALSDHRLRAIVDIKHDGIVVTSGGRYQLDNVGFMEFSPAVVKRSAGQIGKHSPGSIQPRLAPAPRPPPGHPRQGCPAPFSPSSPFPDRQSERGPSAVLPSSDSPVWPWLLLTHKPGCS